MSEHGLGNGWTLGDASTTDDCYGSNGVMGHLSTFSVQIGDTKNTEG